MNRPRTRATLSLACAVFILGSCSGGSDGDRAGTPTTTAVAPFTAVALGDGATVPDLPRPAGVRDGWAQRFYVESLPRTATFVNLASRFATTGEALERDVPALMSLRPRVAVLLFGIDDLNPDEDVTTDEFAANFASLLDAVVAAGPETIMVATIPDEAVGADTLNPIVREAVAARDLTLVDLTHLTLVSARNSSDRFIPDVPSQRKIAAAFGSAYRSLHR